MAVELDESARARIEEALQVALVHQQQGKPAEAEKVLRQILAIDPSHAESLHQMGIMAFQVGRLDAAEKYIGRAIAADEGLPAYHYHLGLVLQNQGKADASVAAYRGAVALKPDYFQAHNNLGSVLQGKGDLEGAVAAYGLAAAAKPDFSQAHHNLGEALMLKGDFAGAESAFRRAGNIAPREPLTQFHYGLVLHQLGRLQDAAAAYRRAAQLKPDYAEAWFNLGIALHNLGELDQAAEAYKRMVALAPAYADGQKNLGYLHMLRGRPTEALVAYEAARGLEPRNPEAHANVGSALISLGRIDEAMAAFEQSVALAPAFAAGHYNLAMARQARGRIAEAEAGFARALALKPDYVEAHNNLGSLLQDESRLEEAVQSYGRAIALKPDHASAHSNLGSTLQEQGKRAEALASFDRALAAQPDFIGGGSARLMALHYGSEFSPADLRAEHMRWAGVHGAATVPAGTTHPNTRDPERPLRVGFVSGDLRTHSVAYFLEPLLRAHDPAVMETVCYSGVVNPDTTTLRLQGLSDGWRSSLGLSDEALAELVRTDRIDILIDLSGHTDRSRLSVFGRKPAPVQATWLGYPNTTGLGAMDYRLVDPISDPVGVAEGWASEALVRLDGGFLCYRPPELAPDVAAPPSVAGKAVTFGSFNNPAKLSAETILTWAKLLAAVPGSRLLLKGRAFADATARALLEGRFAELGIEAARLDLRPWVAATGSHLEAYGEIDVALDPFPYNGTTTTCEALWMGVPVVALEGDRHAGRVGASLLTHAGLFDLIAADAETYVKIAAALAADPARLADLRKGLRLRLQASPLMDAEGFARRFEAAMRLMWRRWCAGEAPVSLEVAAP